MTAGVHIACGNVAWEREFLDAGAAADVPWLRRHVDAAGVLAAVRDTDEPIGMVLVSPALRGFDERTMRAIAALAPLIIIVDGIEPTWLEGTDLDVRQRSTVTPAACIAAAAAQAAGPERVGTVAPRSLVTAYIGVSGGVGVTSLAVEHAAAGDGCVLVEGNFRYPALAVAAGLPGAFDGWPQALAAGTPMTAARVFGRARLLPANPSAADVGSDELEQLLAGVEGGEIIVDAGCLGQESAAVAAAAADRVVVVAEASPLGIIRLCLAAPEIRALSPALTVMVNRVRESATGSGRPGAAIRDIVHETFAVEPVLVAEQAAAFDTAWLHARWPAQRVSAPRRRAVPRAR